MAKSTKDRDRRAIVEEMRKKQQAQERRRTLIAFLASLAVAAVIIGFALVQYLDTRAKENRDLSDIGVAQSAASCQAILKKAANGNQQHVNPGTPIDYPDAPPAFGKHWGNFLSGSEIKNFYTTADRPEVERLVHSLEHGYTILWYDQTIADDDSALEDVRAIAQRYPVGDHVIVAPWTKEDGDAFPKDAHIALTHWTGGDDQQGVWEYCGKVSGEVAQEFIKDYPASNAPEAGGV